MPALDVKVVPADEDRFGAGHGYNTSPSAQTPAAIQSATGKIRAKAQLLAAAALEHLARHDHAGTTARSSRARIRSRPKTIADIALYAHGTGVLPPGVEGGLDAQTVYKDNCRAFAVDRDRDLVGDLERSEQSRVRLHPECRSA